MATSNLVLRTVYISPDVDDKLREQAFDKRTSKNDLIRRYLELGMRAAQEAGAAGAPAKVVVTKVGAKKAAPAKAATAKKAAQSSKAEGKVKVGIKVSHGAAKVGSAAG